MNSPQEEKLSSEVLSFSLLVEDDSSTLSPVTNLTQGISNLNAKNSGTPNRKFPRFTTPTMLLSAKYGNDSSFCNDSPTFQEGILKDNQKAGFKLGRFSRLFKNSIVKLSDKTEEKENVQQDDTEEQKVFSEINYNSEDSSDENSKTSHESGFVSQRSFRSQSSVPSIRSSVFTDEELDDDDESIFSINKFIENDLSVNISSSMTQLIKAPLKDSCSSFLKNKASTSESDQTKNKLPMRRCLSMVVDQTKEKAHQMAMLDKIGEDDLKFCSKFAFKRPEPLDNGITPTSTKRRKSSPLVTPLASHLGLKNKNKTSLVRCYSENAATIMKAVQRSVQDPDLIGDCSKPFALPMIDGRHADLKSITGETLIKLLSGEFKESIKDFCIVDCRYPYEFNGGHIKGAKNIFTKREIYSVLLSGAKLTSSNLNQSSVIIFHCEFSSERAPKLLRFLRNKDREINEDFYPRLHHPEIYILDGGYKAFYQNFKEYCEPQDYKPMTHKDHSDELKEFQKECKSKCWGKMREIRSRSVKLFHFE